MATAFSEDPPDRAPAIEWDDTPVESDQDFLDFIRCEMDYENLEEEHRISVPENSHAPAKNQQSYASFGEKGTTASVNAYGKIMQISRFFGYGNSGFFCADQDEISEPYYVQSRMEQLIELSKSPFGGAGLNPEEAFEGLLDLDGRTPSLEFIFDRWPRFSFERPPESTPQPPVSATHQASKQDATYSRPLDQPQESKPSRIPELSIQFFCDSGSVFQKYTFAFSEEKLSAFRKQEPTLKKLDRLRIDADFLIRNLDFVQNNTTFNENDQSHIRRSGPNHRSLIILHKITWEMAQQMGIKRSEYTHSSGPKAAALIITPFVAGEAQKVKRDGEDWYIELNKDVKDEFVDSKMFEIVLGYRLQLLEENQSWKNSIIPASHLKCMGETFSSSPSFRRIRFSQSQHLDFVVRRNLEHMLSVCCIPVPERPHLGHSSDIGGYEEQPAVAITCGDISAHRVGPRASLFAFRFLLSVFEDLNLQAPKKPPRIYLNNPETCSCKESETYCSVCKNLKDYVDVVRNRIKDALQGHVKWVCGRTDPLENGTFSPHYWATGECIKRWKWLPSPSLVDTPLQLLKILWLPSSLHRYQDIFQGRERLKTKIRPWISKLDKSNESGRYAFEERFDNDDFEEYSIRERLDENDESKFRLSDHVLICLAIRCVEELGLEEEIALTPKDELSHMEQKGDYYILNEYSYAEVRRNVLKRFTAEGPLSKQRMLATCRTPTESRFLLHSKDTILFHVMGPDSSFFQKETSSRSQVEKKKTPQELEEIWAYTDERWKSTVDGQAYYDEYQYSKREKPLWVALIFILASQRRRVNKLPIEETLRTTASVLLGQYSQSGLLPGLFDEDQQSTTFRNEMDRDSYWHTTFETTYILWAYGKDYFNTQAIREKASKDTKGSSNDPSIHTPAPRTMNAGDNAQGFMASTREAARTGQLITKTIPFVNFNTLIDQKGLVEVSDDWLQQGPAALDFNFRPRFDDPKEFERAESSAGNSEKVIAAAVKSYRDSGPVFSDDGGIKGAVIDIPKGSPGDEINQKRLATNSGILTALARRRTVQTAKKRVIWLPIGDKETALLCYLASPERERDSMLQFLNKHASHEKYFFDGATAELNEWETELHLSFFRFVEFPPEGTKALFENSKSRISESSFVRIGARDKDRTTDEIVLSRATMSFRFVGDFFDRFWTCHFLEHDRKQLYPYLGDRLTKLHHAMPRTMGRSEKKKNPWQQRKVLELLLFNEMMEEIYDSTSEILDWVKSRVLHAPESEGTTRSFSKDIPVMNLLQGQSLVDASLPLNTLAEAMRGGIQLLQQGTSENYFSIIENWRLFEQILQAIEDDLSGNIERIDQWNRREEDRELERPRWTRNDEKRYRTTISKVLVLNQRKARDIVRLRASIKAFRESLPSRLASIRDDISFRGSENINLFTYVTVVFLPLGFATGVFSMSEAPNHSILVSMVELALIAIALTIFALANAKTTGKVVVRPVIWAFRHINNVLFHPAIKPLSSVCYGVLFLIIWIQNRITYLFCRYFSIPAARYLGLDGKNLWKELERIGNLPREALATQSGFNAAEKAKNDYETCKRKEISEKKKENAEANERAEALTSTGRHVAWPRIPWYGKKEEDIEVGRRKRR